MKLEELAQLYRTQEFIFSGVDKAAIENNRLVIESLKAAGEKLGQRNNRVYGFQLAGSRLRGYNTVDSDIDIVIVAPDTTPDKNFVYDAIQEQLDKRGIQNKIDSAVGMWAEHSINTNPDEFLYTVDHNSSELITLFGHTVYQNPNLLLARLTALEVVARYTEHAFPWNTLAKIYSFTYLGEREDIVAKLAERYSVPFTIVESIFSEALFHERLQRFGLDPKALLIAHRQWKKEHSRQLAGFTMSKVYREVMKQL